MPNCKSCGYQGPTESFHPVMTPYHDLRCPNRICNSTNIDTSEINVGAYSYGNDNCLKYAAGVNG